MADEGSAETRQRGLRQVASIIFALIAVVPLLIFAWTLHAIGAISGTQAQVSLGLALSAALLGFWLFRLMLGRVIDVLKALAAAVEQANRAHRPAGSSPDNREAAAATSGVRGVLSAAASGNASHPGRAVPGIGQIRELHEVVRTMDALWHREATAHLGRRVQVTVANSNEPVVGTLSEASGDGLILDQQETAVAIAYGRVTAIDRVD